jgi:RNA polymerase sigma-70 factor (ECF subfamily)
VTHPSDDAALAARAKLGDVSAFEVLIRMYEELAFRTAWLVTGSSAEAQDAVQDAFLKAHRSLGRFRTGLPFSPLAPADRRQRSPQPPPRGRPPCSLRGARCSRADTSNVDRLAGVARPRPRDSDPPRLAIERLAPQDRVAIVGRYVLDLSVDEVAAALGVRRGAAKMRIARALERLGEELDREA